MRTEELTRFLYWNKQVSAFCCASKMRTPSHTNDCKY